MSQTWISLGLAGPTAGTLIAQTLDLTHASPIEVASPLEMSLTGGRPAETLLHPTTHVTRKRLIPGLMPGMALGQRLRTSLMAQGEANSRKALTIAV